jgi:sialate O-acetylesterase
MKVDGAKVRLSFEHATGLSSGDKPPACFTIAGEDRKFVPANAEIDGESIIVSSDAVAKPLAVRFAWGAADQPNLKNKTGLPASSFRTDDWPGVTQPRKK